MSFFKKKNVTTSLDKMKKDIKDINEDDEWLLIPKSPRMTYHAPSPRKKKAATTAHKTKTTKTPTKQQTKLSFSDHKEAEKERQESIKKDLLEKEKEILPTNFERYQAYTLLDSIKNKQDIDKTISTISDMGVKNMRKMIRYATDDKKLKTLTSNQQKFIQKLHNEIKTQNPHIRMIHEESIPVAELKINWTSRPSSLPRGVIVIVHTHGGFANSRNFIKYPSDVNDKLESVSTLYASDIGARTCNVRDEYNKLDNDFIGSFLGGPLDEGLSIKDISKKAQEIFKYARLKEVTFIEKKNMLENYFESGVYNLAVSTKANNIPFLNKNYSCGKKMSGYDRQSIQVVDYGLVPLSNYKPEFDCQNDNSSITTLELVNELSKAIPNLKHVLIIDTSCSVFTPSIIRDLFRQMPDYLSSPHKYRQIGLFNPPLNEEREKQISTLRPYFPDLVGGKKTKKRKYIRRYNKNKSIKNKNKTSRKYMKTYYMRGGATTEQIAAAVVMRTLPCIKKNQETLEQLNDIVHHENMKPSYYDNPPYTFNYKELAQKVIEDAYNIINTNPEVIPRIKEQIKIVRDKAAASKVAVAAVAASAPAPQKPISPTLARVLSSGKGTLGVALPAAESAVAPQKQVSPTLARVLSSGSGTLGTQ